MAATVICQSPSKMKLTSSKNAKRPKIMEPEEEEEQVQIVQTTPTKQQSHKLHTSISPSNYSNSVVSINLINHSVIGPALARLNAALASEARHTSSGSSSKVKVSGGITCGMRDGSAHVLRCLKVWYDLPSDVFFNAVSHIDRFLAKMRAQPKHLSCIAVSAFHLACRQYRLWQAKDENAAHEKLIDIPEPSDLVTISQSRCSPSDLLRMQNILITKLELDDLKAEENAKIESNENEAEEKPKYEKPVTSLDFLRLMYALSATASQHLGILTEVFKNDNNNNGLEPPAHLVYQLEILTCNSLTLAYRPAEVALSLLAAEFQRLTTGPAGKRFGDSSYAAKAAATPASKDVIRLVTELRKACAINSNEENSSEDVFVACLNAVAGELEKYNGEGTVIHRQRLIWKLSNRTLRHLRPTDKLRATLPTIEEGNNNNSQQKQQRLRSNSECSDESMESLYEESSSGSESE